MYDHKLHCGRKHFRCYYLQAFSTGNVTLKIPLKLMVNKVLKRLQRVNTLDSKIMREK